MTRDDDALEERLLELDFVAPPIATVWRRPAQSPRRLRVALAGLGVAAALILAGGALAASTNWFGLLVPGSACADGSPGCGPDYHVQTTVVDHTTGTVGLAVLVRPGVGTGRARLSAIAVAAAQSHADAPRVIVYVFRDLPPGGTLVAAIPTLPGPRGEPEAPLPALQPYLLLTYDATRGGGVAIWP